jgi:hypothetical protein
MLLLQNLVFWCTAAFLAFLARTRSTFLSVSLALIGFMPQIISQLSTIWKDVALAVALFACCSLLFYAAEKKSRAALILSPVFLFYGYAARLNSFPAVLPIAIWSVVVALRIFDIRLGAGWRRTFGSLSLGLVYFVLLSASVYLTIDRLTDGKSTYPFQQVYLYDLAAISVSRSEPLFPAYVLEHGHFSLENVKTEYNTRVNSLIFGNRPNLGDPPILPLSTDPEQVDELRTMWLNVVSSNPGSYFLHRWKVFSQLIGSNFRPITAPYFVQGFEGNPAEFQAAPNFINRILMAYFHVFRNSPFFMMFLWLAADIFFAYKALKNRLSGDWEFVFVLSASSILFTAAYFPTTPSTEFRYLFWPAIASAIVVLFGIHLGKRSRDVDRGQTLHRRH